MLAHQVSPPDARKLFAVLHLDYDNAPRFLLHEATYHASVKSIVELYGLGMYHKVAVVLASDLEKVFTTTQGNWVNRHGVGPIDDVGHRPTNIGDIIVDEGQQPYAVAKMGFEPLPILLKADDLVDD